MVPLFLGKKAEEFTLADTHLLLSDFGESFNPVSEPRSGENCHTPLAARPPEALFQPNAPPPVVSRHLESRGVYLGDPWYEGYFQR